VPDRTIKCADCGSDFVFTEREQEWYQEKGLSHEPRRCKGCRSSRKSVGGPGGGPGGGSRDDQAPYSSSSDGEGDHGGAPPVDRPARPPHRAKEMHSVACATCGKQTEVPFKPDPSRPVYCRDCYVARGKKR
jgi:CxxC-x17-CxxC domain-containing protein